MGIFDRNTNTTHHNHRDELARRSSNFGGSSQQAGMTPLRSRDEEDGQLPRHSTMQASHSGARMVPISESRSKSKIRQRFDKMTDFDLLAMFEPKRKPGRPRTVLFGHPLPVQAWAPSKAGQKQIKKQGMDPQSDQLDRAVGKVPAPEWEFSSNQVLTSKYNVLTFIPKNLLEQFRRVANIFFLILVILQFFPRFSNVSPALAALPLIVVLALAAVKDAYEDVQRHRSDRTINNLTIKTLKGPGFHNVNITEEKRKAVSLVTLFPFLSGFHIGTKHDVKKAAEESERQRLAEEAELKQISEKHHKDHTRNFWGRKKRRVSKMPAPAYDETDPSVDPEKQYASPPIDAPGGGNLQSATGKRAEEAGVIEPDYSESPLGEIDNEASKASSGDGTGWTNQTWENLRVGDFVLLRNDDSIPADIVICATSEEENVCYVETKNLDGETNLKSRSAIPELSHLRTAKECARARFIMHGDVADNNMFKLSAAIELLDGPKAHDGANLRAPITLNTTLLRGCVLRNTDWVIGVVLFTGSDTKIVLNSGGTPSKRSKIERLMNPMVFINLGLLALMCMMCAIGDHFSEQYYYDRNAYWEYRADRSDDNPRINGIVSFANAMITFQNIVPISLYISIEVVRTAQAFFIWGDDEITYKPTQRRTLARSWNLSDDLGQIEYVFSDKTGTLTQNQMQFRECSVGGVIYRSDQPASDGSSHEKGGKASTLGSDRSDSDTDVKHSPTTSSPDAQETFVCKQIGQELADTASPQARRIYGFFANLALCHTVLASEDADGSIQYKAQSPDEAALVQAAADVGFIFRGRDKNILRIETPGSHELSEFELLNVLEFTSARKRMSVVVRKLDGDHRLFLLVKGADNVVFERLAAGNEELKRTTDQHLEVFASEGLRTLTLAYKDLDAKEYEDWASEYHAATVAMDDREAKIEEVSAKIENNLQLLGATAIEDKLQEGVPEAIADLKRAGIKVWVATGDKLETAIAIGMSSNLLTRDMNLIIVKGGAYDGTRKSAYYQLRKALVDFFGGSQLVDDLQHQPPGLERSISRGSKRPGHRTQLSQASGMSRTSEADDGLADIVGNDNGQRTGGYGLVIDGSSLTHAFQEEFTKELMLELSTRCQAVVCCRTSPLQKALIVKLVREGLGAMCLAIGDGANDVSMIQAADVGVGVAGEEGLQAVNSSDYAIGQFAYLKRLLLVHGHWSYMRNANMIVNFFYKEIIGIAILFFFQFYCAYSTTTVYEYIYLLLWNIIWSLLPVIAIGFFDRNISDRVLMAVPELYRYGREHTFFGISRFCWYMIDGIYQGAVIYFFVSYTYDTTTSRQDGYGTYLYEWSTTAAIAAVIALNMYNGLNTHAWTGWVVFALLVGPVLVLAFTAVYSAISPGWISTDVYGNNSFLWPSAYFYFSILLTVVLALMPRTLVRYYKEMYIPTDIDILKWVGKYDPNHDFENDPQMPITPARKEKAEAGSPRMSAQLPRTGTLTRQVTDMSGHNAPLRGFGFDMDDSTGAAAVGRPLRTYTSRTSSNLQVPTTRNRRGSIRLAGIDLGFPTLKRDPTSAKRRVTWRSRANTRASMATSEDGLSAPNTPRAGAEASPSASPNAQTTLSPAVLGSPDTPTRSPSGHFDVFNRRKTPHS
ncbi:uncharacterized protein L969DRAFT_97024 [Mixia osmundae IAM 14324]|uniref:Phospholipid-transporting ATPase n=1 Tax=Mixia osmundae (strain CBS 9802 / IAM 14324 / JCM 22182 / KY 12970) TaxID=764103 RepID=G7E1F8_MIXOS|nr:uncharacterized protein L969DRAFT_97024 [Mixia osmundae IAM 14324]KEI36622.1 hypothetical protein L969DRAFT_97024 [Mixia osmundae IAM 14324]GAA96668.1 hypothetical protein E5Q_03339 [Mixia osmundae IAM 14324]